MPEPSQRVPFDAKRLILPAVLFLIALLIRIPGIGWGLKDSQHNQSLHPDEELNFRVSRLIEPAHLQFTPGFYSYGTLYLTTLRVADDVAFAYSGGSEHPTEDWDAIRKGEFAGRIVSLLSGCLLVLAAYFTARRLTSETGAVAAGLALAVSPGLVVHSRFATVDVFATLFIALAALYAVRLLTEEGAQWLKLSLLAGLCAGLSAGTKYTGFLAVLMPIAALGLRRPPRAFLYAGASIGAAIVTFIVTTPGCILDSDRFLRDFKFEMSHSSSGHGMVFTGTSSGFFYHIGNLFLGMGLVLVGLGAAALVWALVRKQRWPIVLLAFAIPYYLVIGRAEVKFMRYVFPLMIPLALGVGYAVGEGNRLKKSHSVLVVLGIIGLGGLDGGGLRGTAHFTGAMMGTDNRELVKPNLGVADATVGLISNPWFWSPTLYPDVTMGPYIPASIRQERLQASTDPHAETYVPADGSTPEPYDPRLVTDLHPEFIAFSDFESMYVDRVSRMNPVPPNFVSDVERYRAFRSALQANYTLVAQYGDSGDMVEDMRYVIPTVYVWRRKSS